jgi:hypothetical protein
VRRGSSQQSLQRLLHTRAGLLYVAPRLPRRAQVPGQRPRGHSSIKAPAAEEPRARWRCRDACWAAGALRGPGLLRRSERRRFDANEFTVVGRERAGSPSYTVARESAREDASVQVVSRYLLATGSAASGIHRPGRSGALATIRSTNLIDPA